MVTTLIVCMAPAALPSDQPQAWASGLTGPTARHGYRAHVVPAQCGLAHGPRPWPRPGVRDEAVTIAGQLCTPKDVLARRIRVARLRAGDLVAFGLAGEYAWNISHHGFLMHPPPAFHYLP
jgi:diaminopimelate decarboxylase